MNERRKIILFTSEFPPGPGGIGNHAWNLARYLYRNGYVVEVYTDSRAAFLQEESAFDAAAPFPVIRSNRGLWGRLGVVHRVWLFAKGARRVGPEDCLIASGKIALWLIAFFSLFQQKGKRVAVLHGSEINYPSGWKRQLSAWSLRRYHRLIAVSRFTAALASKLVPEIEIMTIPNGFEADKMAIPPNGRLKGEPVLITVGSVSPRKGQHNVVQALPRLKERFPNVQYHIVGLPLHLERVEALANKLKVADRVTAHGPLDDREMVRALRGSDVFCMLSENQHDGDVEGFGIAILEANACGLPAIGSKGCGIEDAIADGFSGRLVDPTDPDEVASALEEILQRYDTYSRNAQEWAASFTWEVIIRRYINAIEQ